MNDKNVADGDPWKTLRPLTRRRKDGQVYSREARTEEQIQALCALSEPARRGRLAVGDRHAPDFVCEEALVYCLRAYHRAGDDDFAWQIAERLVDRTTGHVRRQIERWRLSSDDADDCVRDLFTVLLEAVFDNDPAGEFWEVRFWVCLDRRLWNLLEKQQAATDLVRGSGESAASDDADTATGDEPLLRVPDSKLGPDRLAELNEALALLTENERLALFLCRVEGWPEESDDPARVSAAKVLGVTGRSVRNYLRRAETKLRAYQEKQ